MADISVNLGNIRGLKGNPGQDGQDGARGSLWHAGTALTHTSGSAATETGINGALAGDMYLNTETSNVYRCTTGGDSGEAVWEFLLNTMGLPGVAGVSKITESDNYDAVTVTDYAGETTTFRCQTRATVSAAANLLSDFATYAITNVVIARGDVVYMDLYIGGGLNIPVVTDTAIGQLPSGCHPPRETQVPALINGAPGLLDIEANGAIQARYPVGTNITQLRVCTSFMRA